VENHDDPHTEAPRLAVFGDSIASGHHRDREGSPTHCQDETYSYGQTVWNSMEAAIPARWRLAHGYDNVANSGFSTTAILRGGKDACGANHPAELATILKDLRANAGSWNRVVGTAGIDDIGNWPEVLTDILKVSASGQMKSQDLCQVFVDNWKMLSDPTVAPKITNDVREIASKIQAADDTARLSWTGYYNIATTGTAVKIPAVCTIPFAPQPVDRRQGRRQLTEIVRSWSA
jgi:hypothetical protein